MGATYQHPIFTAQLVPVPLHRGSLNAVMAEGHVEQITGSEYQQPGGPTVTFQVDPRQNWWREGAATLLP